MIDLRLESLACMALLSEVLHRAVREEVSVAGICEQAIAFRGLLASAEPGAASPARCAEIAEELASTEKACAAARVRFAARAVESSEHRKRGFADASDWMAAASGSSRREARDALETVTQAGPELRDALVSGEVYENLVARCRPHHDDKTERDRKAGRLGPKRKERGP